LNTTTFYWYTKKELHSHIPQSLRARLLYY